MKRLLLFLFTASLLFAIEQVPRQAGAGSDDKPKPESTVRQAAPRAGSESRTTVQKTDKERDRFQDKNSDGVNDRREHDFQNIKTLKSRFKELFGRKEAEPAKKPAPSPKQEEKQPEKKK